MKIYTKENQIEKYGFVKTSEKVEITFNGWDGKSYNGESRKMNVWKNERFPEKKFVYLRKGGFESTNYGKYKIDAVFEVTDRMVVEQETGIEHPEAEYYTSWEVPFTVE